MPKFIIRIKVVNNGSESIRTHVGASLVGVTNHIEYYNTADDIDWTFSKGENIIERYLNSDLGAYQKYDLYVALWELAKPIGEGVKYASAIAPNAVEKKKKVIIGLSMAVVDNYPKVFFA